MFKVTFSAAALMHVCFLIMFFNAGIASLAVFNIFSVLLYLAGIIVAFIVPTVEEHVLGLMLMVYGEVTAHAVIATMLLGFDPCFLLYALSILPMCAFTLFSVPKKAFTNCMIVMPAVSTCLIIATLIIDDSNLITTRYVLNISQVNMMRVINIIFNLVLVFGFSFLFINMINNLINQLNSSNERLNYTATHDALTGLYNRHYLWTFLAELHKSNDEFCVCMGDIDNFKRTNDTFGHECGDMVLKNVTGVIRDCLGECDLACRWGGEEILVILFGSHGECLKRVEKMRRRISEMELSHDSEKVPATMTFGFADCIENTDPDDVNLENLISLADKRLYQGKRGGKNIVVSE